MPDDTQPDVLSLRIDQLVDAHNVTTVKVDDLTAKLVEPPNGLFMRVQAIDGDVEDVQSTLSEVTSGLDKLVDICSKHEIRTSDIEGWMENHEERDGELREQVATIAGALAPVSSDLIRRMGLKKWTDKIVWLIMGLIITGLAANLKARYAELNDLSEMKQMIERQEKRELTRSRPKPVATLPTRATKK